MIDVMRQVKDPKVPKKPKGNGNKNGKGGENDTPPIKPEINLAQDGNGTIACFCCGGPHPLRDCPKQMEIPRKDWVNPNYNKRKKT